MLDAVKARLSLNSRTAVPAYIPPLPTGTSIPRILHQTYHAPPLPDAYAANVVALQRVNPGWDHRFYDYDDRVRFIHDHYGERVVRIYESISPSYAAARADLFRYLALYQTGGVYLDMKSLTRRPLDDVLRADDVYLLSHWRDDREDHFPGWGLHRELDHRRFGEFQQWFIAAAPGHPFLKAVIERVLHNVESYYSSLHGTGAYAVFRVTGPIAYTLAIEPIVQDHPYRMVDSRNDLGLLYSIFDDGIGRSHEQLFPHYNKVSNSLVDMTPRRQAADRFIGALRGAYTGARGLLRRMTRSSTTPASD